MCEYVCVCVVCAVLLLITCSTDGMEHTRTYKQHTHKQHTHTHKQHTHTHTHTDKCTLKFLEEEVIKLKKQAMASKKETQRLLSVWTEEKVYELVCVCVCE